MNVCPIWAFVHNVLVHPPMGIIELLTWGHYMPKWIDDLHDYTASKANFI